jgi:hypothetical protein
MRAGIVTLTTVNSKRGAGKTRVAKKVHPATFAAFPDNVSHASLQ